MADFGNQVRAIAEKHKIRVETVVRKTVIDMGSRMIEQSPVDTGRFKSNWQFGQGSINRDTGNAPGFDAAAAIRNSIATAPMGGHWYITNSLPYASRLEHGWSRQAPAGMVRITIAEFKQHFDNAVRAL